MCMRLICCVFVVAGGVSRRTRIYVCVWCVSLFWVKLIFYIIYYVLWSDILVYLECMRTGRAFLLILPTCLLVRPFPVR